jgi:DNA gyrase/topoisomerase IV subunit B
MTDQDHDGSHIKGLVINFFHYFWPKLLEGDEFLQGFVTPIVKAKRRKPTMTKKAKAKRAKAKKDAAAVAAEAAAAEAGDGKGGGDLAVQGDEQPEQDADEVTFFSIPDYSAWKEQQQQQQYALQAERGGGVGSLSSSAASAALQKEW